MRELEDVAGTLDVHAPHVPGIGAEPGDGGEVPHVRDRGGERLELRAGQAEVHLLDVALDHLGAARAERGELRARGAACWGWTSSTSRARRPGALARAARTSRVPMKPG